MMNMVEEKIDVERLKLLATAWEKFPGVHTIEDISRETGLPPTVLREIYDMLEIIKIKGLYPERLEGTEGTYFIKNVTI